MHEAKTKNELDHVGIHMDTLYCIRTKPMKLKAYVLLAMRLLLMMVCLISTLYCAITGLKMEVNHQRIVLYSIIFCVIFHLILISRKYKQTALPMLLFVFSLIVYERKEVFLEGFYHIENIVIRQMNKYYNLSLCTYQVIDKDGTFYVTAFMIEVAFILSFIYSCLLDRCRGKFIYFISTLPFVLAPCLVGEQAQAGPFLLYTISTFGMCGILSVKDHKNKQKKSYDYMQNVGIAIGVTSVVVVCTILFVFNQIFSQEAYEKLPIKTWKQQVQSKIEEVNHRLGNTSFTLVNETDQVVGGLSGGKLNVTSGKVTYTGSKQLKVIMEKGYKELYLKGYAGVNYEGDCWGAATDAQKDWYNNIYNLGESNTFMPDAYTGIWQSIMQNEGMLKENVRPSLLQVIYVNANKKYAYYPYYTLKMDNDNENMIFDEAYIRPKEEKDSHSFSFHSTQKDPIPIEDIIQNVQDQEVMELYGYQLGFYEQSQLEKMYRRYVYDVYSVMPESTPIQLIRDCYDYKKQIEAQAQVSTTQNGVDISATVAFVKKYLADHTEYTLNPGPLPEGKDYIEYFLYENHKGYCAHYASAATIMLRVMGVPARYVEGYRITEKEIKNGVVDKGDENLVEVTVKDSSAHAWVEIYLDGFGWYPVEFTKASTQSRNLNSNLADTKKEQDEKTDKDETKKDKKKENEIKNKTSEIKKKKEDRGSFSFVNGIGLLILIVSIGIILIGGILGYHWYRCRVWREYLRSNDKTTIYQKWYEIVEKLREKDTTFDQMSTLFQYSDWITSKNQDYGICFEDCEICRNYYLKAVYSKEKLNEVELLEAREILIKMYAHIYARKSVLQKLWYRYYVIIRF